MSGMGWKLRYNKMQKKNKFYVVWKGRQTGIFSTWESCKEQIDGFPDPQYKSFESREEAEKALEKGYYASIRKTKSPPTDAPYQRHALAVDAAWNTKSGDMEYQGIYLHSGERLFLKGPFPDATNKIGEFLAIVHALALLTKQNSALPIYSDSLTAISWVRKKKANTKLERTAKNAEIFDLIERAEKWLATNRFPNPILKWDTEAWGENPADFGRK